MRCDVAHTVIGSVRGGSGGGCAASRPTVGQWRALAVYFGTSPGGRSMPVVSRVLTIRLTPLVLIFTLVGCEGETPVVHTGAPIIMDEGQVVPTLCNVPLQCPNGERYMSAEECVRIRNNTNKACGCKPVAPVPASPTPKNCLVIYAPHQWDCGAYLDCPPVGPGTP